MCAPLVSRRGVDRGGKGGGRRKKRRRKKRKKKRKKRKKKRKKRRREKEEGEGRRVEGGRRSELPARKTAIADRSFQLGMGMGLGMGLGCPIDEEGKKEEGGEEEDKADWKDKPKSDR